MVEHAEARKGRRSGPDQSTSTDDSLQHQPTAIHPAWHLYSKESEFALSAERFQATCHLAASQATAWNEVIAE